VHALVPRRHPLPTCGGQSTQFLKLAKDCQLLGPNLNEADTYVAYTAEVKRKQRVGIKRMNYNDFLTALMKLSTKVRDTPPPSRPVVLFPRNTPYCWFVSRRWRWCFLVPIACTVMPDPTLHRSLTRTQVYKESRTIDDAFQRVLMEHILPLASRRYQSGAAGGQHGCKGGAPHWVQG
jgi:hypothetical protein